MAKIYAAIWYARLLSSLEISVQKYLEKGKGKGNGN